MAEHEEVEVKACILCHHTELVPVINFGGIPLPNKLPLAGAPPDIRYTLDVVYCAKCHHVQLGHIVPPLEMFEYYTYVPSTSKALTDHFFETANVLAVEAELKEKDFVVDIGGNDGLLLSFLQDMYHVRGLNVDPAINLREASLARGVEMAPFLFNESAAHEIVALYGKAKAITATNCLAHTAELASYLKGVEALLDNDGIFMVEAPYLYSLIDGLRFDTIYHEHQSYMAVWPLHAMLPFYGLRLDGVTLMEDVHGGSLRLWIRKQRAYPNPVISADPVTTFLRYEQNRGNFAKTMEGFASAVVEKRDKFINMLDSYVQPVAGIGASAKASIILNYANVGMDKVKFVADANPLKQGHVIPGVHIPIVPEEKLAEASYVVNFIWNIRSDVEAKLAAINPNAVLVEW